VLVFGKFEDSDIYLQVKFSRYLQSDSRNVGNALNSKILY